MAAPALLAGGNMGTGVASLNLICEGIEEGVVKRKGGVGEAALTSGGAEGLTALRRTRMGSRSGAWMTRMKRWAPSMPLGPSCLSRYRRKHREGLHWRVVGPTLVGASRSHLFILCLSLPTVSPNPVQKGPKEPIPEEQELDFQGLEEEEEEPPEGLVDEGGPEAGEPAGGGQCLEPVQAGRGALTRLCHPPLGEGGLGKEQVLPGGGGTEQGRI